MNVQDIIELDYADLPEGSSLSGELCPACKGGSTSEYTFSISRREGHLYFKCHRASCSFAGGTGVRGNAKGTTKAVSCRGAVGRSIIRSSDPLSETCRSYLLQRYRISERHISKYQLGWDTTSERLCLPVSDVRSEGLGVVLRSLSGAKPKTLSHTETGVMSWYPKIGSLPWIIVEDQLSAIRVSDYVNCVALLGTNLNEERVYAIKKIAEGPVYLALDKDAWDQAVRYAVKWRSVLGLQLLKLHKDFKEFTDEELASFMSANVNM